MLAMLTAALVRGRAGAAWCAIVAGVLYGAADAAIKADAVGLRAHGAAGLLSGWTLLVGLCTFAGFLSFQAALRAGDAVRPLSLMNAFTALIALALGVAAFGEPLGTSAAARILHVLAIAAVLSCVRPLARAQQQFGHDSASSTRPYEPAPVMLVRRPSLGAVAASLGQIAAVVACALATVGLLYALRGQQWLRLGPSVPDALPLLQLAGFDAQPLALVITSAVAAGAVLGLALIRVERARRVVAVALLASALMLVASDASYALARNLRFGHVLLDRAPGLGPWLEGLLLALGCALPGRAPHVRLPTLAAARALVHARRQVLVPLLGAGFALAGIAALLLPSSHARAQPRSPHPVAVAHQRVSPLGHALALARISPENPAAISAYHRRRR
jgi:hypothetical protein